MIKQLKEAVKK